MSHAYRLVVGLGNPGPVYEHTRHNIGFEVLDRCARAAGAEFREERRGPGEIARLEGSETLLLKPHTYMNRSGEAIRAWLDWKKWAPEELLVIVDEVALPLGALRFRPRGSAGGHNGLKDIERHLGTPGYARLRCGVGPMPPMWSLEKFVLAKYVEGEEEAHRDLVEEGAQALAFCLERGLEEAMNRYNRRLKPVPPEEIAEDAGAGKKNPALSPDSPPAGD
ncbi:MAG: aminoacyl-tRNA hydrolase [Verrucomicrobiota bacterium]